jgi:alkanesulfonate monooxygenase SsuD/methylene tetrahydromethanopterin reductase-like flavin-dependent oxidoreductase (luciferase family)
MKASYFGCMGYSERHKFPATWPVPPSYYDPKIAMQSYQEGIAECELAEELGFDWVSLSEHHYSGNRTTPNPAVMAAAVAERCRRVRIALLGQLLPLNNPIRAAEEIGMLDNLTGGRMVVAFMRGTLSEDQVYGVNPAEGRDRLIEGMDLVLKALTEPQPFSWEGRYYQFRTVSVWPRPVQQPFPPTIVATRSDDTVQYAAAHQLGLGISYDRVEDVARVTEKYYQWCQEAGWQPTPDQIVYRGSILLAETDRQADQWLERLKAGLRERGMAIHPSVSRAVQAARAGEEFDPHKVFTGSAQGGSVRDARGLVSFIGGPDTIVKQLKAFHHQCSTGIVDLAFQQPGIDHREVMKEIELFGREVLPRIKEF